MIHNFDDSFSSLLAPRMEEPNKEKQNYKTRCIFTQVTAESLKKRLGHSEFENSVDQTNQPPAKLQNKTCVQCKTTKSPEWRKTLDGEQDLCNACGLRVRKIARKQGLFPVQKPLKKPRQAEIGTTQKMALQAEKICCLQCKTEDSRSWHAGPFGPKTLCHPCWETSLIVIRMDIRSILN